jgi:hypothetical protein
MHDAHSSLQQPAVEGPCGSEKRKNDTEAPGVLDFIQVVSVPLCVNLFVPSGRASSTTAC